LVAEQHCEHGREHDDRDGYDHVDPEEPPEHSDVIAAVAGMAPVSSMAVVAGMAPVSSMAVVAGARLVFGASSVSAAVFVVRVRAAVRRRHRVLVVMCHFAPWKTHVSVRTCE
jgi:hypothetical protein